VDGLELQHRVLDRREQPLPPDPHLVTQVELALDLVQARAQQPAGVVVTRLGPPLQQLVGALLQPRRLEGDELEIDLREHGQVRGDPLQQEVHLLGELDESRIPILLAAGPQQGADPVPHRQGLPEPRVLGCELPPATLPPRGEQPGRAPTVTVQGQRQERDHAHQQQEQQEAQHELPLPPDVERPPGGPHGRAAGASPSGPAAARAHGSVVSSIPEMADERDAPAGVPGARPAPAAAEAQKWKTSRPWRVWARSGSMSAWVSRW